jgi:hypothetical protein
VQPDANSSQGLVTVVGDIHPARSPALFAAAVEFIDRWSPLRKAAATDRNNLWMLRGPVDGEPMAPLAYECKPYDNRS